MERCYGVHVTDFPCVFAHGWQHRARTLFFVHTCTSVSMPTADHTSDFCVYSGSNDFSCVYRRTAEQIDTWSQVPVARVRRVPVARAIRLHLAHPMLNTWSWTCQWTSLLGLIRQSGSPPVRTDASVSDEGAENAKVQSIPFLVSWSGLATTALEGFHAQLAVDCPSQSAPFGTPHLHRDGFW